MFTTVTIAGLGPHAGATAVSPGTTLTLDPAGITTIRGRSESGKSTLLHALCFLLWGTDPDGKPFDVARIHGAEKRAEVTAVTAKGTKLRRSITPSRTVTRGIEKDEPTIVTVEAEWRRQLGRVGDDLVGRLVLVPLAWTALAAEKSGRPLRDALLGIVGAGDLRATVGTLCDLRVKDSIELKVAEQTRAAANKASQQAAGALAQARTALQDAEGAAVVGPTDEEVQAARAAVAAYSEALDAWRAASADRRAWLSARDAHARAQDDAEAWDRRAAAVGEEPPGLTEEEFEALGLAGVAEAGAYRDLAAATAARDALERLYPPSDHDVRRLSERLEDAVAALAQIEARTVQPCAGVDAALCCIAVRHAETVETYRADVADARAALDAAESALAAAVREHQERTATRADMVAKIEALEADATTRRDAARASLGDLTRRRDQHEAWADRRAALGDRPTVPELAPEPAAPPEPVEPANAEAVLAAADRAAGALAQRSDTIARARTTLDAATTKATSSAAEAKRLDALVEAIRKAPGVLFAERIALLGDLGPVSLHTDEDGGLDVRIDGRPWPLASRGRQVVADLAFRAAIRVAAKLTALPIIVDNVQDVGGQPLPRVPGPLVLLVTDGGELRAEVPDVG